MSYVKSLRCRECGREYPLEPANICEFCFGSLEVTYDYAALRQVVTRQEIERGPLNIWRYRQLLPVEGEEVVDMQVGFTPLVKAQNLAEAVGLKELYLKNDCINPSYSFKDRAVSVTVSKAIEFGFDTVACASTGNLANSVAAHAAKANLSAYVFIPADLEEAKITACSIYGPTVVAIDGDYDAVNRLCSEIASIYPWAFVNINFRPYYAEGSKTLAFEVAEQLGWQAPDHVVAPMASGCMLVKLKKGFDELLELGLTEKRSTKISGAQASGCSPIVTAFKANTYTIDPVEPHTIAKSLAIGNPADGRYAVKTIRESGGYAEAASDQEIVEGIKLLAETEGIFAETAGGVTVAALKKLVTSGRIGRDERTVAYITGNGLKTQDAVAGKVGRMVNIEASLASFEATLGKLA